MEKLFEIQRKLKAPKDQFNEFGKYNYRSCESILEAVKPILSELHCTITLSDDMVQLGERYYIKATASVLDVETGEKESVTAYAREAETKSGMDAAQITGAASSYARKYALNGLLAIDDTKDADATNDHSTKQTALECCNCGEEITGYGKYTPEQIANMNKRNYGRELCAACAMAEKKKRGISNVK